MRAGLIQKRSATPARPDRPASREASEVQLPFLKDAPWARDLVVNLSGRFTDHQYCARPGPGAKALWSPTEWLTAARHLRHRPIAPPNLREFFLGRQTGFIVLDRSHDRAGGGDRAPAGL